MVQKLTIVFTILLLGISTVSAYVVYKCPLLHSLDYYVQLTKAVLGEAKAQYELSNLYFNSSCMTPSSFKEGIKWLRSSASKERLEAIHALASIYGDPTSKEYNPAEAQTLIENAAEKGDSWAQIKIAHDAMREGDSEKARYWAIKAASTGELSKQQMAGDLFATTHPPNYEEAYYWRRLSAISYAALKKEEVKSNAALEGYKKHLTSEQIESVEERIKQYTPNVCTDPNDKRRYTCSVCPNADDPPGCNPEASIR